MTESELKKQKKRESNKKYQEKIKKKLEEAEKMSKVGSEPKDEDEIESSSDEEAEEAPEEDPEESYVLDKKAYLYLLEKAKLGESIEEEKPEKVEKKPEKPNIEPKVVQEDPKSFFFQLKNSFKTTAISLIPVLTMQIALHGGKLLTSSTNNSQSKSMQNQPNKQPSQFTTDFGLPVVNAL